eukprot:gene7327-11646_t
MTERTELDFTQKKTHILISGYVNTLKESTDPDEVLQVIRDIRNILSTVEVPPISDFIDLGCVPLLVQALKHSNPKIQFEAAWALSNICSGDTEETEFIVNSGCISGMIQLLSNSSDNDALEQCIWCLGNIAIDSIKFRNDTLEANIIDPLVNILQSTKKISLIKNAIWCLSNTVKGEPQPPFYLVKNAVPVLCSLLSMSDQDILKDACWSLSNITEVSSGCDNEKLTCLIKNLPMDRLVTLLSNSHEEIVKPALRIVGNILTGDESQTDNFLYAKGLPVLGSLLKHQAKSIRRDASWSMSNITAGSKNHIQQVIDAQLFPVMISMLSNDDPDVCFEITWALCNATAGTSEQISYLVSIGILETFVEMISLNDRKKTVILAVLNVIFETDKRFEAEFNSLAKIKNLDDETMEEIKKSKLQNYIDVLVLFKEQLNFSKLKNFKTSDEKAEHIFEELKSISKESQRITKQYLTSNSFKFKGFYSPNCVLIYNLQKKHLQDLKKQKNIQLITLDKTIKIPLENDQKPVKKTNDKIEWNIKWIQADKLWEKGFKGKGIIVSNADTGIKFDHPGLINSYRGNKSPEIKHDYSWYDAIHDKIDRQPNVCGYNLTKPCDDYGHGSHVIGTVVGEIPDKSFGIAPKAKWMGCRNMDHGLGKLSTFLECLQYYLAPTDVKGKNPKSKKRPHVIVNSYGCGTSMCKIEFFHPAVKALVEAGIAVVASAGNDGRCGGVKGVPAIFEETITVGATKRDSNSIISFSSKGPVVADRSNRMKPNLMAPGDNIFSSIHCCGLYSRKQGTSMAAPHVAGAIALLWNALPKLERNVKLTKEILEKTALHQQSRDCSSSQNSPNNVYGFGSINVLKAYEIGQKILQESKK